MTMFAKVRGLVVVSVAVIGLAGSPAVQAASLHGATPVRAMFRGVKMVRFNMRNDSVQAIDVKIGESQMTIQPGKTIALHLAVGTRVLACADCPGHKVGELLAEVSPELNDATVAIK